MERLGKNDIIKKRTDRGITFEIGTPLQVRISPTQTLTGHFFIDICLSSFVFVPSDPSSMPMYPQELFRRSIDKYYNQIITKSQTNINAIQSGTTYMTTMEYSRLGE